MDGYEQAQTFGSNVVVGDDGNGAIYFLDPDLDQDEDAVEGSAVMKNFRREVYGQLAMKGYASYPCYGVQLQGSTGDMSANVVATVKLSYSDDRGTTYVDADTYTMTPGDLDARIDWRSLGSIRSPARS